MRARARRDEWQTRLPRGARQTGRIAALRCAVLIKTIRIGDRGDCAPRCWPVLRRLDATRVVCFFFLVSAGSGVSLIGDSGAAGSDRWQQGVCQGGDWIFVLRLLQGRKRYSAAARHNWISRLSVFSRKSRFHVRTRL